MKNPVGDGEMMTKGPEVVHTAENDISLREAAVLITTGRFSAPSDGLRRVQTVRLEICQRCHVFCSTWAAALKVIQDVPKKTHYTDGIDHWVEQRHFDGHIRMAGQPNGKNSQ